MAHILIVDDDPVIRIALRQSLRSEGHKVTEAPDGQVALVFYRERHPDLIITNIVMPEKDGLEVIRELRRDFPVAKIIALTGYEERVAGGYLQLAREYGAARTFTKPFDRDEMMAAVKELLAAGT